MKHPMTREGESNRNLRAQKCSNLSALSAGQTCYGHCTVSQWQDGLVGRASNALESIQLVSNLARNRLQDI